jgi:pilus assembly protein CpaC
VLGLLFGSHTESTDDTDGAIFIVPSIVESVPRSATEMIDAALEQYREYHGDLASVHVYDPRPAQTVPPPPPPPPPPPK